MDIERILKRAHLELTLEQDQVERLSQFLATRAAWSETHNLSGPKALALTSTDIADAVAVWRCWGERGALLDVGSGSGAPGLMVACLAPKSEIHLVEPIAKRCAFMRTAAYQLGLTSVSVYRGRWPSDQLDRLGEVTPISRAVVSPEEWPRLGVRPHLNTLMQMLAQARPPWPLDDFELQEEIEYQDPEGGERLVRRWCRRPTTA